MNKTSEAIFGTGCFWCTEAVFELVDGIQSVTSGYTGGHLKNPTYEQIGTKTTGHAEVVKISYDPTVISYEALLEMFWRSHDPTTLNRQGNDVGPQYRSAIFYQTEKERNAAEASKQAAQESGLWEDPIVTEITALDVFYPAEDHHQNYFERVGTRNPYCTYVVGPKVTKFKSLFAEKLKG